MRRLVSRRCAIVLVLIVGALVCLHLLISCSSCSVLHPGQGLPQWQQPRTTPILHGKRRLVGDQLTPTGGVAVSMSSDAVAQHNNVNNTNAVLKDVQSSSREHLTPELLQESLVAVGQSDAAANRELAAADSSETMPSAEPAPSLISGLIKSIYRIVPSFSTDSTNKHSSLNEETASNNFTVLGRTPQPNIIADSNVYMSIKTSGHTDKRLAPMLLTWMQTVMPQQVFIITDMLSKWTRVAKFQGFQVVVTSCPSDHERSSLCCKSGREYELYFAAIERKEEYSAANLRRQFALFRTSQFDYSVKFLALNNYVETYFCNVSWYCHFDDDVYVNTPALMQQLGKYNGSVEKIYLGHYPNRWRHKPTLLRLKASYYYPNLYGQGHFYATGASYCVSSALMGEVKQYLRDSATFVDMCHKLTTNDDIAVGMVVELLLGYKLTEVGEMQSHVDKQWKTIEPERLKDMITVGYSFTWLGNNIVNIPNSTFSIKADPTRFLSYHCLLYGDTSWCLS